MHSLRLGATPSSANQARNVSFSNACANTPDIAICFLAIADMSFISLPVQFLEIVDLGGIDTFIILFYYF